jgi:hypothetical protein
MTSIHQSPLFKRMHIAPCGMNCGICIGHLRSKNQCSGCNSTTGSKANHCEQCSIKHCAELKTSKGQYCFSCEKFPCRRVRQLDKRYRTKYAMSMIDNLRSIEKSGIKKFLNQETKRWRCTNCNKILSVHRPECITCGALRNGTKERGL